MSVAQVCKLLLVAESKAFFSLYTTLSAAGIIAVQLDREKQLPMQEYCAAAADSTCPPIHETDAALGSRSDGDHDSKAKTDAGTVPELGAAAFAAWQSAVKSVAAAADCVLATHAQLHHQCMPLQEFHVVIEYTRFEDTAAGEAGQLKALPALTSSTIKHFVFQVQEPNLQLARVDMCSGSDKQCTHHAEIAGADSNQSAPSLLAAAVPAEHTLPVSTPGNPSCSEAAPCTTSSLAAKISQHKPKSASLEAGQGAQAEPPDISNVKMLEEAFDCEVPLLLNVSTGSLTKQRLPLYQSLMQLETQGYVLIERPLDRSRTSGTQTTTAAAVIAAAVDIILSPQACLCIWDENKLPKVRVVFKFRLNQRTHVTSIGKL